MGIRLERRFITVARYLVWRFEALWTTRAANRALGEHLRMSLESRSWARVTFLTLPDGRQPAQEFLESIDTRIAIRLGHLIAKIASDARAAATPSGYWKPMRAELGGVWELRCTGPGRVHYRLFVLVDRVAQGSADEPQLILLDGARKQNATLLPEKFYVHVEELTSEYWLSLGRRPL